MKRLLLTTLMVVWIATMSFAGEWVQNGDAWMYKDDNGEFVVDTQRKIDEKLYFFDENGNLLTGLQKIKNRYYYFNDDGTPKTETFVFNGSTYKVNPRGMIIDISENQFEALKDNVFASNADNASTELTWNLDIANNLLNKYPLSKRMLRKMIEIKVGQEKLTTDKVDWAMANAQVNYKEQAIKCAKAYLQIRNAIGNPANQKDLIEKMKNYGFNSEDAMYASNSSGINWSTQAFKTAMVIKVKTPSIQKDGFIEELINYDFTEGEANSAVQRAYDAFSGGYLEQVTDEEKIQKLIIAGFDRNEA